MKAAAVFLCFLPPRGGARRTLLGNIRNCFQESVELVSLIKAKARVMAWAHISRAAFGMCFKVLGRAFKMSENEGKFWPMSSSSSRASVWGVVAASLVLRFSSAAQVGWMGFPLAIQREQYLQRSLLLSLIHWRTRFCCPMARWLLMWCIRPPFPLKPLTLCLSAFGHSGTGHQSRSSCSCRAFLRFPRGCCACGGGCCGSSC